MARISIDQRRELLVSAAFTVVAQHGVAAATTRAIVGQAGMALASFHYAFESRDELMAELVNVVLENEQAALIPEALTGASFRATVREGLQRYLELLRADPLREKAMLELTHYALRDGSLRPLAARQYSRYHALAEHAMEVAGAHWRVRWTVPVDQIARFLVTITDGVTIGWLVDGDTKAAEATLDHAADYVATLVVAA
jgi:AcrR family transcriptional regulator